METLTRDDSQFFIAMNREIRYLIFVSRSCTFAVSKEQFCFLFASIHNTLFCYWKILHWHMGLYEIVLLCTTIWPTLWVVCTLTLSLQVLHQFQHTLRWWDSSASVTTQWSVVPLLWLWTCRLRLTSKRLPVKPVMTNTSCPTWSGISIPNTYGDILSGVSLFLSATFAAIKTPCYVADCSKTEVLATFKPLFCGQCLYRVIHPLYWSKPKSEVSRWIITDRLSNGAHFTLPSGPYKQ